MDVDLLTHVINELTIDDRERGYDSHESEGEDSDYREDEEDDEENNNIYTNSRRQSNSDRNAHEALSYLVNSILTDEQRVALRNGECFFCHKKGHWFNTCPARKAYLKQKRKGSMGPKQPKRQDQRKGTRKPFPNQKKRQDPNTMVYQIEELDEEEPFEEYSNNGNF